MKVLVIQQKMIGDVLTSTILCEAIKQAQPSAEVHYLINQHTVPVIINNPFIDKQVVVSAENEKNVVWFYKLARELKQQKYDAVIDVYSKNQSAFLTYMSNARVRVGVKKTYLAWAYSHQFAYQKERTYSAALAYENRLRMLQPIISDIDFSILPKIYIEEEEKRALLQKLSSQSIDVRNNSWVMVNILGSGKEKTYPLPYMAKLLNAIVEGFPAINFFFNYMPSQQEEVNKLLRLCTTITKERVANFYATSLREFIVLSSFCTTVIGNEGGAINMAKALSVPTFAIFSPWVKKDAWGTVIGDTHNETVHLNDFDPTSINVLTKKQQKEQYRELYRAFKPELFMGKLLEFIRRTVG